MKRIVHIVGSMNRAGAETMVMNLYRQIDRSKYQFDFVYFTNQICDYDDEIIEKGGNIYRVPSINNNVFIRYKKLFKLLKNLKNIHAVHSHMNINNSAYLTIAKLARIKNRISHSHGTSGRSHKKGLRKLYKNLSFGFIKKYATTYIACGEAAGKYLYPKVNEDKIIILPNAIDVLKFSDSRDGNRNYLRDLLKIKQDTHIISQIGRLNKVKNHKFSIDFCKYLKEKNFKFHFVIIGDGELRQELETKVKQEKLNNHITFVGVRSDVPELLSGSDCMLMPSFHEGFPVVLVESQAIGVPSLISSTISKEVDMGIDLIKFASLDDDYSIWYDAMFQLINQEEIEASRKISKLTKEGFNIVQSAKQLEKIYG